jgi:xanthine dehydrogenase small subunit
MAVEFLLNGRATRSEGYAAHTTLLDFLRAEGLTGSKEGCAEGECGACTVVAVRPRAGSSGVAGSAYVPINSCLMPLATAAGQEIYTVEALAAGRALEPAQQAMVDAGGSQCGYCTPGFVMSLFAEHYRPDREGSCEVEAMGGNLCRCTGYRPILEAARSLGSPPEGPWRERLTQPAPKLGAIHEDGFSRPATLPECLDLLEREPEACIVAGATDLAVESNLKSRRFRRLVSVEALAELRVFRETNEAVEIGAGLTLTEIAARWTDAPAVFREWLPLFASPLIRNRATLGGNLATASPIGDAAPLLLALDATVKVASAGSWGTIALEDFFVAYRRTALQPGELLVSVVAPKDGAAWRGQARFFKIAKRKLDDISSVAACFALALDEGGRVESIRLAYGGVAATPVRAFEAEGAVLGRVWNENTVHRAQDVVARTLRPIDDHRASAAYRLAMAQSLIEKFWWEQQEGAAA